MADSETERPKDPRKWYYDFEANAITTLAQAVEVMQRLKRDEEVTAAETAARVPYMERTAWYSEEDAHMLADAILLRVLDLLAPRLPLLDQTLIIDLTSAYEALHKFYA